MPISTVDILKLVGEISEEENVKVSVAESLKGGAVTGITTLIGGLCLGPIGLAAGGIAGGLTSYYLCQGKFESVPSIILKMEPSKRELLANRVRNFLQSRSIGDAAMFSKIMASPALRLLLIEIAIGVILALGSCIIEKISRNRREKQPNLCSEISEIDNCK